MRAKGSWAGRSGWQLHGVFYWMGIIFTGISNWVARRTPPERSDGNPACINNPAGGSLSPSLLILSHVLSCIGQNHPHGELIPYNLQVAYLTTIGSPWGSPSLHGSRSDLLVLKLLWLLMQWQWWSLVLNPESKLKWWDTGMKWATSGANSARI